MLPVLTKRLDISICQLRYYFIISCATVFSFIRRPILANGLRTTSASFALFDLYSTKRAFHQTTTNNNHSLNPPVTYTKSKMAPIPQKGENGKSSRLHSKVVSEPKRAISVFEMECSCLCADVGYYWIRTSRSYSCHLSSTRESRASHVRRLYGQWFCCGWPAYHDDRWYAPTSKSRSQSDIEYV